MRKNFMVLFCSMRAIIPCPGQIPELFNTYHFFFLSKYYYSPAPLPLSPMSGWGFLCIGLGFGICGSSSLLSVIASSMDWFGFLTGVCSMVSLPLVHLILNGSHSRCLLIACQTLLSGSNSSRMFVIATQT